MVYLLLGQDTLSKDIQIKKLKQQFLPSQTQEFNLDTLYARDASLKELQERLLCIPVHSPRRMIIIRQAHLLKEEIKEFILKYARAPRKDMLLVMEAEAVEKKDNFLSSLARYARVMRFKDAQKPNTFLMNRYIELRRPDYALRVLGELLQDGERPERILGGLRYIWEKDVSSAAELKRRMRLLLGCDIDIKTGKLRPSFALEKLVIGLCGLGKAAH
jgi:DNA polymerase III delta subunit